MADIDDEQLVFKPRLNSIPSKEAITSLMPTIVAMGLNTVSMCSFILYHFIAKCAVLYGYKISYYIFHAYHTVWLQLVTSNVCGSYGLKIKWSQLQCRFQMYFYCYSVNMALRSTLFRGDFSTTVAMFWMTARLKKMSRTSLWPGYMVLMWKQSLYLARYKFN